MSKTHTRIERLDQLLGLLKSGEHHLAADLARQLEVSKRTLMRDLALLKEKGYPVETDRGRGGGLRLHRRWGVGRLQLSYKEVIDLLLSMAIMEKQGSAILLDSLKAIRHKIALSFPQEQRERIQALRQRVLIGELASTAVMASYDPALAPIAAQVCEAFFDSRLLAIQYQDQRGQHTQREVEAQYLYISWPVWYLLVWDRLRQDVRCLRLDRIQTAEILPESFASRRVEPFIQGFEAYAAAL